MKTNTLNKIIFTIIILVTILAFDIFFLITTNRQLDKIVEVKKEMITESVNAKNLNDTKRKIEELKVIEERVNNILIEEGKIVNFISLIEETASQNEVEILIQKVDFNMEENKMTGILDMDFQVSGSWQNVTSFITTVESLPYLINIESLRLSATNLDNGSGWSANISLNGIAK